MSRKNKGAKDIEPLYIDLPRKVVEHMRGNILLENVRHLSMSMFEGIEMLLMSSV
jgi:hypothetical protein